MPGISLVLKSWLFRSLVTGLVALAILCIFHLSLVQMYSSYMKLYEYQSTGPGDLGAVNYSYFILNAVFICLLGLSAGMAATALARRVGSEKSSLLPALIAGLVPTIAIDGFLLISYINSLQYQYSPEMQVRPAEPVCLPLIMGFMVIATALCLIPALAGGWLVSRGYRTIEK